MAIEIERRFVVRADARLLRDAELTMLRQGYLTVRDATTVRIRQEGPLWVLAIKAEASRFSRHEIEVEVPEEDGRALLRLAVGGTVEKTRYTIGRWEVDVFRGRFSGLTLAEAELHSETEELPELPPGLELIHEITSTRELSNRGLAAMSEEAARELVERLLA